MKICKKKLHKYPEGKGGCPECRKRSRNEWKKNNIERERQNNQRWYIDNKDHAGQYSRQWQEDNKEQYEQYQRLYQRQYQKQRSQTDINFKIARVLRTRLNQAIKYNQKSGSAVADLGCSIDDLRVYLESRFESGMDWDNHGKYGWHIDHIIPLSSFDLSNRDEFLKACNYTNLQPLWAEDNLVKSNKLTGDIE